MISVTKAFFCVCTATALILVGILCFWGPTSTSLLLLCRQDNDDMFMYGCGQMQLQNLLSPISVKREDLSGNRQSSLNTRSLSKSLKSLDSTELWQHPIEKTQEDIKRNDSLQSKKSTESFLSTESLKSQQKSLDSVESSQIALNNSSSSHSVRVLPSPVDAADPMCIKCLSESDKAMLDRCGRKRSELSGRDACHFVNGSRRAPVALASFPGSGNTWMRGLLEKATGVCTGSVYCDGHLLNAGMYGESIRSGSVLVVKTHKRSSEKLTAPDEPVYTSKKVPFYGGAILIIRNPYDACIAEWNRRSSGHTGTILTKDKFGEYGPWNAFLKGRAKIWSAYFRGWVVDGKLPVHVVRFEDVKADAVKEVKKILDYLNFDYVPEEIEERLKTDYGTFHRKHSGQDFEHFTREQRLFINQSISDTIDYLKSSGLSTLGIQEYLWYN